MVGDELTDFLSNIEEKIGKESCEIIKILDYHLELLRNESPLSRPKSKRTVCAQDENVSHSKVGLCFSTNSCRYELQ